MPQTKVNVKKEESTARPLDPEIQKMMDAGVFYGSTKTKTHPAMKQYVIANRNGIEIIDIEKSLDMMRKTEEFVSDKVAKSKTFMFVGTQPPAQASVLKAGKEYGSPMVTSRWLGGTLTNFAVISERIKYYNKLKSDFLAGAFDERTKRERLEIEREIEKMEKTLGGIKHMEAIPDFLIVIDPAFHKTAMREAKRLNISVVTFINTDSEPIEGLSVVVGNTRGKSSIEWFMSHVSDAIREGLKKRESKKVVKKDIKKND